jgi:hypothetical protein
MRCFLPLAFIAALAAVPADAFAQAKEPEAVPKMAIPPPSQQRSVNIQVEITITDQLGSTPATKKTVSVITSDSFMGRIRTNANARPNERTGTVPVVLNVDARPRLIPNNNDLIQLDLAIEYQPLKTVQEGNAETSQTSPTALNQSLTVVMTSGRPLIVSQAADPVTDRKIVVEAKATILK